MFKINIIHITMDDEELIAAKMRQALRRNEPELRTFEQKLRDALVLKEQICQIKEKRHRELLDQVLLYSCQS